MEGGIDGLDVVEDEVDEGEDASKRIEGNRPAGLDRQREPLLATARAESLQEIDLEQGLSSREGHPPSRILVESTIPQHLGKKLVFPQLLSDRPQGFCVARLDAGAAHRAASPVDPLRPAENRLLLAGLLAIPAADAALQEKAQLRTALQ